MINIHDFKTYWDAEIAKGKYNEIHLEESIAITHWDWLKISIGRYNYYLNEFGNFNYKDIVAPLLIKKHAINSEEEYEWKKILDSEYYDDLISSILDIVLHEVYEKYTLCKDDYKTISNTITTSGLYYKWSDELYGEKITKRQLDEKFAEFY